MQGAQAGGLGRGAGSEPDGGGGQGVARGLPSSASPASRDTAMATSESDVTVEDRARGEDADVTSSASPISGSASLRSGAGDSSDEANAGNVSISLDNLTPLHQVGARTQRSGES